MRRKRLTRAEKQTKFWIRMLYICTGLFALAVYGLVSTLDLTTEVNAGAYCHEMVAIYQQSNGEFGWPNCDHL